jgi:hypothetical protein
MKYPELRMCMLDGFNEGWTDLERRAARFSRRIVTLEQVVLELTGADE